MAPDNFVQDPSNTQSFNRYTYCLNNPLKWQDYSGEDWWSDNWKTVAVVVTTVAVATLVVATAGAATPLLVVAIQAGTAAGFVGGGLGTALNGGSFGDVLGGSIKGAFFGAVGGAIGFAAGLAAPAGIIGGGIYGALSGVAVNGILNAFQGRPILEGAGLSAILGGVGGATGGYARAKADGKNVWTGTAKPSVIADNVNESIGQAQVAYDKSVASQAEPTTMNNSSSSVQQTPASELKPTQYITKSKTETIKLANDIKNNGITNPLSIVKKDGVNYIVDGHHRYFLGKKFGIVNFPTTEVSLPFRGYNVFHDLMIEGKQAGWFQYYNP